MAQMKLDGLVKTANYSDSGKYGVVQSYTLYMKVYRKAMSLGVDETKCINFFNHLTDEDLQKHLEDESLIKKLVKERKQDIFVGNTKPQTNKRKKKEYLIIHKISINI